MVHLLHKAGFVVTSHCPTMSYQVDVDDLSTICGVVVDSNCYAVVHGIPLTPALFPLMIIMIKPSFYQISIFWFAIPTSYNGFTDDYSGKVHVIRKYLCYPSCAHL